MGHGHPGHARNGNRDYNQTDRPASRRGFSLCEGFRQSKMVN